jgi:hypothetical protein
VGGIGKAVRWQSWAEGDVIGLAVDIDAGTLSVACNGSPPCIGTWFTTAFAPREGRGCAMRCLPPAGGMMPGGWPTPGGGAEVRGAGKPCSRDLWCDTLISIMKPWRCTCERAQ